MNQTIEFEYVDFDLENDDWTAILSCRAPTILRDCLDALARRFPPATRARVLRTAAWEMVLAASRRGYLPCDLELRLRVYAEECEPWLFED